MNWLNRTIKSLVAGLILFGTGAAQNCVAGGSAPVILVQPIALDVSLLGTAIFTVEAFSLTTMTYQWTQDGVNIPGGTASILTLDNVGLKSQGVYTVVINNAGGSTTSSP